MAGDMLLWPEECTIRYIIDYECRHRRHRMSRETVFTINWKHRDSVKFWPDFASRHYARSTLAWYEANEVDHNAKYLNPPKSPEFLPIETYWAIVKSNLKKKAVIDKKKIDMLKIWKDLAAEVSPELVQTIKSGFEKKVRIFLRNQETS